MAKLSALAAFGMVLLAPGATYSQAYPSKPIRVLVPFSAGSATDFFARIIGPKLLQSWGQPVIVDNRPAAGGVVAGEIVARATPDGHTLMLSSGAFAASAALYVKLPYHSVKDFSGVTQVASNPLVLVVAPALGVTSVKDLIALAMNKPGQINYGSAGIGSGTHYGGELFRLTAGITVTHVPYKGMPEALNDIIAGRLHYALSPMPPTGSLINGGRLIALAVTTKTRSHSLPNVPTVAEVALPAFEYDGWFGIFAPSATARRIVNQLSKEIGRIIALPDVKGAFMRQGATPVSSTPEAFDKLVHTEILTRRKVFSAAGVKPE